MQITQTSRPERGAHSGLARASLLAFLPAIVLLTCAWLGNTPLGEPPAPGATEPPGRHSRREFRQRSEAICRLLYPQDAPAKVETYERQRNGALKWLCVATCRIGGDRKEMRLTWDIESGDLVQFSRTAIATVSETPPEQVRPATTAIPDVASAEARARFLISALSAYGGKTPWRLVRTPTQDRKHLRWRLHLYNGSKTAFMALDCRSGDLEYLRFADLPLPRWLD